MFGLILTMAQSDYLLAQACNGNADERRIELFGERFQSSTR
jgi:hypothetical protein